MWNHGWCWNPIFVTKQMTNEKLGVVTLNERSPESLQQEGFSFVQGDLIFWNLNKHHYFIMLQIIFQVGGVGTLFVGLSPPKPPCSEGTVRQNFRSLFDAINSEKYLGYAICQACKLAYVKLSVHKHDRAQSCTMHSGSVYPASWGKTCAGTILPSFTTIGWSDHVTSMIHKETIGWSLRVHG